MSKIEQHNLSPESLFISDIKAIIEQGRRMAYASVNTAMISTYWQIGNRIVEQEQQGDKRAGYGKQLLKILSAELTHEYGNGFSERYLAYFRKFYLTVPDINILQTRLQNLCWSHILTALRVDDEVARRWYLETTSQQMWSVRTEGDYPTIGIVLCSETDADIARYSILKGNEQLFATKYKTGPAYRRATASGDRTPKTIVHAATS